jgi:hypothetical protein
LEYLSLAFPVAKNVGIGFGLMPYTSVGYGLVSQSVNQDGAEVFNSFSGEGGINRVYFSTGFQPFKNFNVGASVNYHFGNIESQRVQTVENVQFGTIDRRTSRITGYNFDIGAIFTPKITKKLNLHTSVRWHTQNNLVSENQQLLGSINSSGAEMEVLDVNLDALNLRHTELKVPTTTTFGLGLGQEKKWFFGAEYGTQSMGTFENAFLRLENVQYKDGTSMAAGGFFIPDYTSFDNYFRRITYRAGVRFDKTGMVVNEKDINNFGITFGLGLPLNTRVGRFSNVNIGFELGRRGTTDALLVEESYFKMSIGLSLNDRWFQKSKIN